MSGKVKPCPACGKEVAKSAKICPHCGKKLKMGLFLKIIIGLAVLGVIGVIFAPSEEEQAQRLASTLENIVNAQAANISSTGELDSIFSLMSKYTDIQRENKEKEITGKIVQWTLPVYDVNKNGDKYYRVQTSSGNHVGAFLSIYPRSNEEKQYIEGLQTGNMISFKGKIIGTTMRNIDIAPAILVK
jgi:hypothetical protein